MHIRTTLAAGLCLAGFANAQGSSGPSVLLINEIRIDQGGTDNDEYFELFTVPSSASLDGYTYIVIGDGSGGSGTIEAVIDLTGSASSALGLFVAAESTFTLGTADLTTTLNFENSDNVTHVVVEGFTGASGDDLDTDDDGILDVTPWTNVADAISLVESVGSGELVYGAALGGVEIGPDGSFVPAHVFRCLTSITDVRIGSFTLGAFDSPGAFNDACTAGTSVFCDPGEPNSVSASGGAMSLMGNGSIQLNGSTLVASAVPDTFGVFVQADMTSAPMMAPIGGNVCVGGTIVRMNQIVFATGNEASLALDFSNGALVEGVVEAGDTYYYQYFHRDTVFPGGGNFTNGVAITWAP